MFDQDTNRHMRARTRIVFYGMIVIGLLAVVYYRAGWLTGIIASTATIFAGLVERWGERINHTTGYSQSPSQRDIAQLTETDWQWIKTAVDAAYKDKSAVTATVVNFPGTQFGEQRPVEAQPHLAMYFEQLCKKVNKVLEQ